MTRKTERGEGRLSALFFLVLLVAAGYAAWNVVPVYLSHYDFTDKVNETCRTPRYKATDEALLKMLTDEARRRDLDPWIRADSFRITTTENNRRIRLYYERETKVLPGWVRTFKFDYTAEQPLL